MRYLLLSLFLFTLALLIPSQSWAYASIISAKGTTNLYADVSFATDQILLGRCYAELHEWSESGPLGAASLYPSYIPDPNPMYTDCSYFLGTGTIHFLNGINTSDKNIIVGHRYRLLINQHVEDSGMHIFYDQFTLDQDSVPTPTETPTPTPTEEPTPTPTEEPTPTPTEEPTPTPTLTPTNTPTPTPTPTQTIPTTKEDCKKGLWQIFLSLFFKNQGECVNSIK